MAKIAVFYGDNPLASWMLSRGLPAVLRRMGHEVTEIATLPTDKVKRSDIERINKPIPGDVDLVLVSGPEYLNSWVKTFYPNWDKIRAPKACWYHESEVRDDRVCDFKKIGSLYDFQFMPNKEDSERYGANHLQVGVDTEMFYPGMCKRTLDAVFIGTVYPKRAAFLREVIPHAPLKVGNALVQDLDGVNAMRSIDLLSSEYRRVRILVNLPTLSKVLVSKILEGAASGCMVLTPEPMYAEVGVPYEAKPEALVEKIKYYLANPDEVELQAKESLERVRKFHKLEYRLQEILNICCGEMRDSLGRTEYGKSESLQSGVSQQPA